jgi:hypothetical protein
MGMTNRNLASATALALVLGAVGSIATGRAEEAAAKKAPDAAAQVDAQAAEIVQRMAEHIVAADRFRIGGEVAWDVVQSGRPQYRARLTGWDLSPQVTDATFAFDPPKDAEKIAFAPRPTAGKKEARK